MKKFKNLVNTRLGFMFFLIFLLWIKSIISYYFEFNLGLADPLQHIIALINPIGFSIILLSLTLYINRPKFSYILMGIFYTILSILLYANILYYRQFSNFISYNTITTVFSVSKGLGGSAASTMSIHDLIYWIDYPLILVLFLTKYIKMDQRSYRKLNAFATSMFGAMFFSLNLMVAETNRPQLLGRTFDQNYTVKYLGIPVFTINDAVQTTHSDQVKSTATGTDIDPDLTYVRDNYAKPNSKYFGLAKRKNIIIIHLESFQQFLLNQKINDQEVTPFLNSLYNDKETLSFDHFYHEVGAGRTSDAEMMLETGLFGASSGNFFPSQGKTNTAQAAPAILAQQQGYTSAVFHGNVGSFYARDTVYKNFGYDYFFDKSYYNQVNAPSMQYGLQDKLMLSQSVKYLEQLQQPFYTKFITVTNHIPYSLPKTDQTGFVTSDTPNQTVNNYFTTANYLDQSMREFFDYLKASGLYDNSMIVLYGDHYGLNETQNKSVAPLLGYSEDAWNELDDAQMQRVPFMIHMKGLKGGINHEYGGEIDALPTILHLAGVDTSNYAQVGTDLLSKDHQQLVVFRNGNFVTPKYTALNSHKDVYDNATGQLLDPALDPELYTKIQKLSKRARQKLSVSDNINQLNLLRFYTPVGFKPVDPSQYSYFNQIEKMVKIRKNLGSASTSLFSKNDNHSTTNLYNTDAPEVVDDRSSIDNLYSSEQK